jgi:hypothetical protein
MTVAARRPSITDTLEDVDRAAGIGEREIGIMPPVYGEKYRSAITSCIEALSTDLCGRVRALKSKLDLIEQRLLGSAEASMHRLHEHIAVASRLHDEITGLEDVVANLEEQTRDA